LPVKVENIEKNPTIESPYILVQNNSFLQSGRYLGYVEDKMVVRATVWLTNDFVWQLGQCESGNDELKVNWNDNGSPSYGRFQFKMPTLKSNALKYGLTKEPVDWYALIYDGEFQERLVRLMLKEENGWRAWYNCGLLIGLDNGL